MNVSHFQIVRFSRPKARIGQDENVNPQQLSAFAGAFVSGRLYPFAQRSP
ncbi:hypothetical protein CDS [Bradyrhizobium sp.]|nr:hypothetical protein CDS [Bradyrhizobium sp.]